MNLLRSFNSLSLADKVATVAATVAAAAAAAAMISTVGVGILSTDTVQKIHIKRKLLSLKFPKPNHLDQVTVA